MSKDSFDASLGLAFSLTIFERYRKNGLLQAELQHIPGFRGRCRVYIQLVEGKVTACIIEDKNAERHSVALHLLIRVDNERGPFEWKLVPLPSPPSATPHTHILPDQRQSSFIPRVIAPLDIRRLEGWTTKQILMVKLVYEVINGQKTIYDIQQDVPLPPAVVEEALRVLVALQVIRIM